MLAQKEKNLIEMFNNLSYFDNADYFKNFEHIDVLKMYGDLSIPAPTYTILIITYKRHELLRQALDSALNQNGFKDYEIVIYDNDRTRNTDTENMLEEYHKKHKNIYYYKTTDTAEISYGSWNLGLLKTRTEWVSMLHDDDLLKPNFLQTIDNIRKRHPKAEGIAGKYEFFRYDVQTQQLVTIWSESGNTGIEEEDNSFINKYKLLRKISHLFGKIKSKFIKPKTEYRIGKYALEHYYLGLGAYPPLAVMLKRDNMIKLGGWKHPTFRGSEDFLFNINYLLQFNLYYTTECLGRKREDECCDSVKKEQRYYMFLFAYFFYMQSQTKSYLKYIDFDDWFIMSTNFFMAHNYCKLEKDELRPFHLFPEEYFHVDYNQEFLPRLNEYEKELKKVCKTFSRYYYNDSGNIKWKK